MTEALVEKVARAISASKQSNGNTAAVAAQYIETFWRDYLPEARIAVSILTAAPAPAVGEVEAAARAFCEARGIKPDFFYDGLREWQKVGFIDFDLRSAFEEAERENDRLETALAAAAERAEKAEVLHRHDRQMWDATRRRAEAAEADLEKMRRALEFYANEGNYMDRLVTRSCGCCSDHEPALIGRDGGDEGEVAREALSPSPRLSDAEGALPSAAKNDEK